MILLSQCGFSASVPSSKTDDAFVQRQSLLAFSVTPAVPRFTDKRLKLQSVNGIGFALSVVGWQFPPDPKQDAAIGERFYVARVSSGEPEDVAGCEGKGLVTEEMLT